MLANKIWRLVALVSLALTSGGCLTPTLWRNANNPRLAVTGFDDQVVVTGQQRALRIYYAHAIGRSQMPEAFVLIPINPAGVPVAPFSFPRQGLGDFDDVRKDWPIDAPAVLAAAERVQPGDPHLSGYVYHRDLWWKFAGSDLEVVAYRVESNGYVEWLAEGKIDPIRGPQVRVPKDFNLVLIPQRRERLPAAMMDSKINAALATPFAVIGDAAIVVTSPIWVTALAVMILQYPATG